MVFSQVIGEGSYGKVVKAVRKNKMQMRAIKIISKSRVNDPEKFKTEMDILKDLVCFWNLKPHSIVFFRNRTILM